MMKKTVLIRYSAEVGIRRKSSSRHLLTQVQRRIRLGHQLQGIPFSMEIGHGHIILHTHDWDKTHSVLKRTFGISAFFPCLISIENKHKEIDPIIAKIAPLLQDKTFRISCHKVDRHEVTSMDIERLWGQRLLSYAKGVSLKNPDINIRIEILRGKTYFFLEKIPGPGGMSFSPRTRVLVLISGGFDSAVAAWKMMKKGICCDYLFYNMGGKTTERMALQVVKILNDLWAKKTNALFFTCPFYDIAADIKKSIEDPYRQIILKRAMLRAACHISSGRGYEGIVTGESIGQVSSQTLRNIAFIQRASTLPVFRPVLNDDREMIISLARNIGTAFLSEKVTELCGLSQGQPVINPKIKNILQEEKKLSHEIFHSALGGVREKDLDSLEKKDLQIPYLFVDSLEEDAEIIDCQENHMFRSWHVPQARHLPVYDLLHTKDLLAKDKKYILYCTHGTQTPYVAEMLQHLGFEAYCFRGGVERVKQSLRYGQS